MADSISIDSSKCNGCMLCTEVCAINFEGSADGKAVRKANATYCMKCGHCAAACPTGAISLTAIDMSQIRPINRDLIPSYEQFLEFLSSRRSRREYRNEPVPKEDIEKLLAAASLAPSGLNRGNVNYIVITDRNILKQATDLISAGLRKLMGILDGRIGRFLFNTVLKKAQKEMEPYIPLMREFSKMLDEGKDVILYNAPCLILVTTEERADTGAEDAVYAASNIMLAAETLGYGTCVIGFITGPANRDKKLKELLKVPKGHKIQTSLILGRPKFKYASTTPQKPINVQWV